jgi:hypothetical protein
MDTFSSHKTRTPVSRSTASAIALAVAICLGASPGALPKLTAQDQSNAPQNSQQQLQLQQQDSQQAPSQATNQAAPPADPQQGAPPPGAQPPAPPGPPAQRPGPTPPETLTLPAGTSINVRTQQWLSSDRNIIGDSFSATLDQPLIVNGWVVARRGQSVVGRVALAQKAGHGQSNSQLGLELKDVTLVDGQQIPINTEESPKAAGGPSQGQRVGAVAATTAIGAAIGAVAGGGTGAAIGMGVGATAGIGAMSATRGQPTVIPPETLITFTLQAPLQISTAQSQVAFQPVTQRDYGRDQDAYARPPVPGRRYVAGPGYGYPAPSAYPAPYYYGYCSPFGWGCYPYPAPLFLGFYGRYGYGYGGRFFGPFRR